MEASTTPPALQRRKNGFEASCENCRKAKAKCDHQSPCSRCVRQGKTCFFHPAPMSFVRRPDQASGIKRRASSPVREPRRPAPAARTELETPNPLTLHTGAILGYSRRPAAFRVGYMGSTGFGAILQEYKNASQWENPDGQPHDSTNRQPFWYEGGPGVRFGSSILAWLPRRETFERVIQYLDHQSFTQSFSAPAMKHFSKEFWREYGDQLRESPQSAGHHKAAEALTANTRKPLPFPSSNEEWLRSISGSNTRWELVGEVFISMASTAFSLPLHDPLYSELIPAATGKKSFACTMLECADACCLLSDEVATQNHLLQVVLLNDIVGLQSMLGGDTSTDLWKRVGALAAAVTGLGLHLRPSDAESRSALYRETRSELFTRAFGTDKALATFVGRPPLLSSRFVSALMPLDVPRDLLYAESSVAELEKTVDEHGWNLAGKLFPQTQRRALYLMDVLRDEILELSLSTQPPFDLAGRINDLRYRLDATFGQLPGVYHSLFNKRLISEHEQHEITAVASVQLVHLHNVFLVERIDHPGKDERRLLQAARDILGMIVDYWSERDRYPPYRDVIHWYICCYGIPAASSLAIDLWLQTLTSRAGSGSPHRASVIQALSVFVACLEWVGPDEGNYILCARVAKMIQNILERALTPENPEPPLPAPSVPEGFDLTDISLADMPAFGQDWENWFDIPSGWTGAMQY